MPDVTFPIRILGTPSLSRPRAVPLLRASFAQPAYTFGWDTVFAIRIRDVNAELRKPGVSPETFGIEVPGLCQCRGTFEPWQIAVGDYGGDGALLRMMAVIPSGTLEFRDATHDLAGSAVLFDIELDYIAHPDVVLPSGQRYTLQLKTQSSSGRRAVAVTDFHHSNDLVRALAIAALTDWFNGHIRRLTHAFATVDLNAVLAQEHLQWLAPTFTGYSYHNGADEEQSYLGILSMTSATAESGATPQLSPAAIPSGQRAGFLLAPALMLGHVLLPALLKAFPGAQAADFVIDSDRQQIRNVNPVSLSTVTHNGIHYHPFAESIELIVSGDGLQLQSRTRTQISPGIVAYVKQTSFHQLRVVDRGDGTQTLTLFEVRPAESDHWTDISTGIRILEDILILIGIIVGLILTALTSGAALLIGSVIVGLLFGLAAATPELIALIAGGGVTKASPAVDALVDAASATITWQGSRDFRLGAVAITGSLQMGGDPLFATEPPPLRLTPRFDNRVMEGESHE